MVKNPGGLWTKHTQRCVKSKIQLCHLSAPLENGVFLKSTLYSLPGWFGEKSSMPRYTDIFSGLNHLQFGRLDVMLNSLLN